MESQTTSHFSTALDPASKYHKQSSIYLSHRPYPIPRSDTMSNLLRAGTSISSQTMSPDTDTNAQSDTKKTKRVAMSHNRVASASQLIHPAQNPRTASRKRKRGINLTVLRSRRFSDEERGEESEIPLTVEMPPRRRKRRCAGETASGDDAMEQRPQRVRINLKGPATATLIPRSLPNPSRKNSVLKLRRSLKRKGDVISQDKESQQSTKPVWNPQRQQQPQKSLVIKLPVPRWKLRQLEYQDRTGSDAVSESTIIVDASESDAESDSTISVDELSPRHGLNFSSSSSSHTIAIRATSKAARSSLRSRKSSLYCSSSSSSSFPQHFRHSARTQKNASSRCTNECPTPARENQEAGPEKSSTTLPELMPKPLPNKIPGKKEEKPQDFSELDIIEVYVLAGMLRERWVEDEKKVARAMVEMEAGWQP